MKVHVAANTVPTSRHTSVLAAEGWTNTRPMLKARLGGGLAAQPRSKKGSQMGGQVLADTRPSY